MRPRAALSALLLPLAAACARAPAEQGPAAGAASGSAALPAFSREAFAQPGSDAGSAELPVPTTPDPAALDELLAAAPKPAPVVATGADGGTAIGSSTGVAEDAGAEAVAAPPARTGNVRIGPVSEPGAMSSPAMERAARAQLYWGLTQRCRDRDGSLLPPEAVHLLFKLDADGHLLASTIVAEPREERFANAASCMQRVLSTMTFRAPASARGRAQLVRLDVPSVD